MPLTGVFGIGKRWNRCVSCTESNIITKLSTSQQQSVSPLQILANYCRYLQSNRRLFPTPRTLFDMVGCLVSSARVEASCPAPFDPVQKIQIIMCLKGKPESNYS